MLTDPDKIILLCFIVIYISGLHIWCSGSRIIVPTPVKQPWRIGVHDYDESRMKYDQNETEYIYLVGYIINMYSKQQCIGLNLLTPIALIH